MRADFPDDISDRASERKSVDREHPVSNGRPQIFDEAGHRSAACLPELGN